MPYLTIHSPMLQTVMRTTVGRRVFKNTMSSTSIPSPSARQMQMQHHTQSKTSTNLIIPDNGNDLLTYEFSTKQFIIRVNDLNNLGNECLWIVMRDDNLLGDVDIIGATAIPLVDTNKLATKYINDNNSSINSSKKNSSKDIQLYAHFRRDVTFATCTRGYLEGELQCVYFRHV